VITVDIVNTVELGV